MSTLPFRSATHFKILKSAVGFSLLSMLVLPVVAQQAAGCAANAQSERSQGVAPRVNESGANAHWANGSRMVEADREMMEDLAQANLAEIATAKLALDKSKIQGLPNLPSK